MKIFTAEQVKAKLWCPIKYVCVNGEYRFIDNYDSHSDLVNSGEKAISAGVISIRENYFVITSHYSTTLNIVAKEEDEEELSKILNLPFEK